MFFEGFSMQKTPQNHPKYDLENEGPRKSQKVVFLMILGFVWGGKSIRFAKVQKVIILVPEWMIFGQFE